MSSIIVKGMKMPKSCEKCMIRYGLYCMASDYKRLSYGAMHRREEWCPLVALPDKHGDLIDRDTLEPDADYDDGEFWAYSVVQVCSAQAVIEAEDE